MTLMKDGQIYTYLNILWSYVVKKIAQDYEITTYYSNRDVAGGNPSNYIWVVN